MNIKSYSKINLALKVNSKSKNGLHEIQSLYCWINLFDKITINKIKNDKDTIRFKGPFGKLVNRDNSGSSLLKKMRELKLISNYYSITVIKNIPVFGGLGGGTSNAAFILKCHPYLETNSVKNGISTSLIKLLQNSKSSLFHAFQKFIASLGSNTPIPFSQF